MSVTIPIHQFLAPALASPSSVSVAESIGLTALDSYAPAERDTRAAEAESCQWALGSCTAVLALPFLWVGLRWLGVGQKSLEKKYETIIGLLITGREMYGRDIAEEGNINPGSIYILLDRLVEAGLLEFTETDARMPNRRLYRLAIPPQRLPAWLIEDEIDLPLAAGASSRNFFPLVISVSSSGRITLRNQSPYGAPVLYHLQHAGGIQSAISRGGSMIIHGSKALIRSSDGSNYWLCVEKDRCRFVEIKRTGSPPVLG